MFRKISFIDVKNTDRYLFKLLGDKAEIYKTELLRTHPFPEFDKEYFITESVCWNTLAKEGYKIRYLTGIMYLFIYVNIVQMVLLVQELIGLKVIKRIIEVIVIK